MIWSRSLSLKTFVADCWRKRGPTSASSMKRSKSLHDSSIMRHRNDALFAPQTSSELYRFVPEVQSIQVIRSTNGLFRSHLRLAFVIQMIRLTFQLRHLYRKTLEATLRLLIPLCLYSSVCALCLSLTASFVSHPSAVRSGDPQLRHYSKTITQSDSSLFVANRNHDRSQS